MVWALVFSHLVAAGLGFGIYAKFFDRYWSGIFAAHSRKLDEEYSRLAAIERSV